MDIGKKIREARNRCGITQGELAKRIHVSLDTVSRWETGKRIPRAEDIANIATTLGIPVGSLMGEMPASGQGKIMLNAMELKDAIKEIREMSQYTIEQIAEKIGVSPQTVAAWESGAALPSKEQLRQMNLLSGELETLLDRGEDPGIGELSLLGGFIPEKALSPERIQQREMLRRMMFSPLSKNNILQSTTGQTIAQAAGRANRENGGEELSSAAAKLRESVKFGYAALSPQDRLMVKTALQAALADISDIELREKNATITEQSAKTA